MFGYSRFRPSVSSAPRPAGWLGAALDELWADARQMLADSVPGGRLIIFEAFLAPGGQSASQPSGEPGTDPAKYAEARDQAPRPQAEPMRRPAKSSA